MAIYFVETGTEVCAHVRCRIPARALEKLGVHSICKSGFIEDTRTGLPIGHERFPVWVFQIPNGGEEELEAAKRLKAAGKIIVAEFDDDYFRLPPMNPQTYADVKTPEARISRIGIIKIADVVTVSTPELVPIYKHLCEDVVCLPNCIDIADYPKPKPEGDRLILGWASGQNAGNFAEIAPLLSHVVEKYPNVDIYVGGSPTAYDMLKVDEKRKKHLKWVNIANFPKMINKFDIGLIPLQDNKFNRGKSELKGLQYGAVKVPFLASNVAPYRRFAKEAGDERFVVWKQKHWMKQLEFLIENPSLRKELGEKAYKHALSRQIDNHIGKWVDAYDKHISRVEVRRGT